MVLRQLTNALKKTGGKRHNPHIRGNRLDDDARHRVGPTAERIGACPRCAFENGDRVVVRRGKKHPVTVKPGMTLTFGPAPSTPEISLAGEKGVETMSWNEIKARAGEAPALRPTKPADNIIDLSGL